jgi:hypothetical protein
MISGHKELELAQSQRGAPRERADISSQPETSTSEWESEQRDSTDQWSLPQFHVAPGTFAGTRSVKDRDDAQRRRPIVPNLDTLAVTADYTLGIRNTNQEEHTQ